MSNNSVARVTIAVSMFLSCFKLVERIRFLFSVRCLPLVVIKEKSAGGLLGMLLSFCVKEQITTVASFTGIMCSHLPTSELSQQLFCEVLGQTLNSSRAAQTAA